ncbi:MAG: hypothetical protein AAGC85_06015 [Bacteroidota bacterium]
MKSLLVFFLSLWIINAPTTDTDQERLDQFMVKIDKYVYGSQGQELSHAESSH